MTLERQSRTHDGLRADALLRPAADTPPGVEVTLEVEGGRLTITGEALGKLGSWPLNEVAASRVDGEVCLVIEDEVLLATLDDPEMEALLLRLGRSRRLAAAVIPVVAGLVIAVVVWMLTF